MVLGSFCLWNLFLAAWKSGSGQCAAPAGALSSMRAPFPTASAVGYDLPSLRDSPRPGIDLPEKIEA